MAVIETKSVTIDSLIEEEERRFLARIPQSLARAEEASEVLAGGATSNWMISRPAAVWVSHGRGVACGMSTTPSTSTCTVATA